jgi:hypothetical protein
MREWLKQLFLFMVTAAAVIMVAGAAASGETERYALVIGNGNYASVTKLPNAPSDAEAIANKLLSLQFKVYRGIDVTYEQFLDLVTKFKDESAHADTIVFYYAGHGFQLNGSNYLVPVDASLKDIAAIESETVLLNNLINMIHGAGKQTAILLDACRNNPLPRSEGDQDIKEGLAELKRGAGTFIAFATSPGSVSKDGLGRHSPFAGALLKTMTTPKQSISDLLIEVRNAVEAETQGQQTPWEQSSLRQQFYFNPTDTVPPSDERANWTLVSSIETGGMDRSVSGRIEIGLPAPSATWIIRDPAPDIASQEPGLQKLALNKSDPMTDAELGLRTSPLRTAAVQLTWDIQAELLRLNCGVKSVDGKWGKMTRTGLEQVSRKTGLALRTDAASRETLENLLALTGPLCTPEVPRCSAGFRLSSSLKCVKVKPADQKTVSKSGEPAASQKPGKTKPAVPAKKPAKPTDPETSVGGGVGVGSFF